MSSLRPEPAIHSGFICRKRPPSYIVSIYDTAARAWWTILTTHSKDEAKSMLGNRGRIEERKLWSKRKR